MNTKAVNAVENKIKQILKDKITESADLKERIQLECAAIESASKAMEAATDAGDIEAYQKAKAERRDAMDAREMHESRLEKLNNKPLMSKAEYEAALAEIFNEMAANDDQTRQAVAKLADEMNAAGLQLQEAQEHANEVLHRLQHEVYKDADRRKDKNGNIIAIASEEKHVDKWETIRWAKAAANHPNYKNYTGHSADE